jgi:DNA polymerase phi
MASNVLPLFWHLASSSRGTRLGASADLVSAIEGFQRSFVSTKGEGADEDEDDEDEDDDGDDDGSESGMEVDGSDDDDDDEFQAAKKAEAVKLDAALARNNSPDVVYTVKRLVRGLASSRESSRLGFAVALTEVSERQQSRLDLDRTLVGMSPPH